MIALLRVGYVVAAILVLLAVGLWTIPAARSRRVTTALECPIRLVSGEQTAVSFVPQLAERHYIGVALERKVPMARLEQIIGGIQGEEATSRPVIDLHLVSNRQQVATQPTRACWWGSTVGFDLTSFQPVPGKHYSLNLSVRRADPDLQSLNPHLLVTVEPLIGEGYYLGALYCRFIAVAAVIIAVALACACYFTIRVRRAMLAAQPT
jgi:hypothetical protein